MKTIKFNEVVMVSDPCYSDPTWCQIKLSNVLPGEYVPFSKKHKIGPRHHRQSMIMAIHKDYLNKVHLWRWEQHKGTLGVDSGQCGFFSMETYRVDKSARQIKNRFNFPYDTTQPGEEWYLQMCNRTLGDKGWGDYKGGVVSRSGWGDGSYDLFTTKDAYDKIVGMAIDFQVEDDEFIDFSWYKKQLK